MAEKAWQQGGSSMAVGECGRKYSHSATGGGGWRSKTRCEHHLLRLTACDPSLSAGPQLLSSHHLQIASWEGTRNSNHGIKKDIPESTIAFSTWLPKDHGRLIVQIAFCLPSRVTIFLIVSTLFKSLQSKVSPGIQGNLWTYVKSKASYIFPMAPDKHSITKERNGTINERYNYSKTKTQQGKH